MPPLPALLPIRPFTRPVRGEALPPGSKSLTNRALVLAALCREPVTLTGALFSDDSRIMVEALRRMSFTVAEDAGARTLRVSGQERGFPAGRTEIFTGLAGTAARFLTALCAAAPRGVYVVDGTPRMRERPMQGVLAALRALGADVRCLGVEGHLPVEVHAAGLRGGVAPMEAGESSQFLSALLMVAPLAAAPVEMALRGEVRRPFVEMTTRLMAAFGQPVVEVTAAGFRVAAPRAYRAPAAEFAIEPDATAASYLLALPLAVGGRLLVQGLRPAGESLQGDIRFAKALAEAGAMISAGPTGLLSTWERGTARRGLARDFSGHSDTFLTLAALAPLLAGPTRISGIAHTRRQETDRVAGAAVELRRLGQRVIETEDALEIHPAPLPAEVTIETYGDHRFAMSFALLGCHDHHGDGRPWLTIRDPGCCAKTFPEYFDLLARLHAASH